MSSTRDERILQLFEAHFDRVYRFARRWLDAAAAEDIAQETFVRLIDVPDLETREILPSYLTKIAQNLIFRAAERAKRHERALDELAKRGHFDRSAASEPERHTEGLGRFSEALAGLDAHEQQAIRLIVLDGVSYREAATAMSAPQTSVTNWRYRGLRRLRDEAGQRPGTAPARDRAPSRTTARHKRCG
ncbi:MAG: sigma-70 family RNA polymerase sigma factor [Planctomycetota bacterium]